MKARLQIGAPLDDARAAERMPLSDIFLLGWRLIPPLCIVAHDSRQHPALFVMIGLVNGRRAHQTHKAIHRGRAALLHESMY